MDALSLSVWGKNLMDDSLTVVVQFGIVKSNHHEEHKAHEENLQTYLLTFFVLFVGFVVKKYSLVLFF